MTYYRGNETIKLCHDGRFYDSNIPTYALGPCKHPDVKRFLVIEDHEPQKTIISNGQKILNLDRKTDLDFHRNLALVKDLGTN